MNACSNTVEVMIRNEEETQTYSVANQTQYGQLNAITEDSGGKHISVHFS